MAIVLQNLEAVRYRLGPFVPGTSSEYLLAFETKTEGARCWGRCFPAWSHYYTYIYM